MEQYDPSVSDPAAARADGGGEGALPLVRHPVFVCFFPASFYFKKTGMNISLLQDVISKYIFFQQMHGELVTMGLLCA